MSFSEGVQETPKNPYDDIDALDNIEDRIEALKDLLPNQAEDIERFKQAMISSGVEPFGPASDVAMEIIHSAKTDGSVSEESADRLHATFTAMRNDAP